MQRLRHNRVIGLERTWFLGLGLTENDVSYANYFKIVEPWGISRLKLSRAGYDLFEMDETMGDHDEVIVGRIVSDTLVTTMKICVPTKS